MSELLNRRTALALAAALPAATLPAAEEFKARRGAESGQANLSPIAPARCPLRPHIPVLANIPGTPNRGTSRSPEHRSQPLPR
jgi:hypothetical protein